MKQYTRQEIYSITYKVMKKRYIDINNENEDYASRKANQYAVEITNHLFHNQKYFIHWFASKVSDDKN